MWRADISSVKKVINMEREQEEKEKEKKKKRETQSRGIWCTEYIIKDPFHAFL